MANINGLPVNSAVTHAEFMSRTQDTSTVSKISLLDPDVASGDSISNVQKAINKSFEGVGAIDENDSTINDYPSTNYIDNGDDRKVAVAKLDDQLFMTQTQLDDLDALNSQDVTIDPIGTTPNPKGMTLAGQNLNLEPADATNGGVLTAGTQTIGGNKTFANNVTHTGTTTFNGNAIFNSPITFPSGSTGINSTNLEVTDKNIFVNVGGNDASSEGAGLTVDRTGTDGSIIYKDASATKWAAGALGSEVDLVGTTSTQTLTNKTLTSPVINSPTGITKTDVGLANVTNDAQLKRAANDFSSFTEKTTLVADDVFIIEDSEAAGVKKYVKKSNLGAGGSGGGSINLITNGSADDATASIFSTYADGASYPVDGTGGSPTVTTSVSAVSPLTGTKSYLLTVPGSTPTGNGFAIDIPLDVSYRGKSLKISFDYIFNTVHSLWTENSMIWTCYDITNGKIVEPSNIKMFSKSTTVSDKFEATVQFDTNCTSFRLMGHMATIFGSANELKVDNVTVSPSVYVYGTPITDWTSYIPTLTGFGTPAATSFWYRRVGSNIEIRGVFTSGTPTATEARVSLPSGYVSGGASLIPSSLHEVGTGARQNANGFTLPIFVEQSVGYVVFGIANGTASGYVKQNGNAITGTGENVTLFASIPCSGLGSSVQMSDSADTRVVAAKYTLAASTSITSGAQINFATKVEDTHGAVTTGASWKFTAPSAGLYSVSALQNSNGAHYYRLYKNGVADDYLSGAPAANYMISGKAQIRLNAGDYIDVRPDASVITQSVTYITIERISGPSAIAASEKIVCHQENTAGTSIANSGDIVVPFATELYDSHGSFVTDTFTAQTADTYRISAHLLFASSTYAAGNRVTLLLYKNGSFVKYLNYQNVFAAVTAIVGVSGSTSLNLNSGDTIQIRAANNRSAGATSLDTSAGSNWVTIERIK